jgi:hypothetical protein
MRYAIEFVGSVRVRGSSLLAAQREAHKVEVHEGSHIILHESEDYRVIVPWSNIKSIGVQDEAVAPYVAPPAPVVSAPKAKAKRKGDD